MSGDHPERNSRRLENQPAAEKASALKREGCYKGKRAAFRQLRLARRQLEQVFVAGDADEGSTVPMSAADPMDLLFAITLLQPM